MLLDSLSRTADAQPTTIGFKNGWCYFTNIGDKWQGEASTIHGHWRIQNRNHQADDVILREDTCRIYRDPGIFARLRGSTLDLLHNYRITFVNGASCPKQSHTSLANDSFSLSKK